MMSEMKASQDLIDFVEELRKEATTVRETTYTSHYMNYVEGAKLSSLVAGCRLLIAKLGPFGQVWDEMLKPPPNNERHHLDKISGILDSISNALRKSRLTTV